PFVPVQTDPAHHVEQLSVGLLGVTCGVGVLDPEDGCAADMPGGGPVEQAGPDQPDVRASGWRRTEPDSDVAHGAARARDRTGLVNAPIPSISTLTVSPSVSRPTPAGVPVKRTSP